MRQVILLFLLLPFSAEATGLVSRYQNLSARTLPEGVWTFAMNYGQGSGSGSFDAKGKPVSNQQFFSRDLSYRHLLDEINDPVERELAGAAFEAYERSEGESAGRVINDVSVEQKAETFVLGRGLSPKISFFAIFPVVTLKTRFSSRFVAGESLERFAGELRAEGQYQRAEEILEKSQNALGRRLAENGYRSDYPSELRTLANVHLDLRYQVVDRKKISLAADSVVVVPAGHRSDENDFLPLRINEEQYSFKEALTFSYAPDLRVSLLSSAYYHKRFPFSKARRVPRNEISPLSPDIDPSARVQYGDTYGGSLQANFAPTETWTFYAGQSREWRGRDKVSGNDFSSERYDHLEKRTSQELTLDYVGVAANTIKSFLSQKFPIPVDMNLQYARARSGKNAFAGELVALNLMVFYK